MSRNLAEIVCQHCYSTVGLVEEPRPLTEKEAGIYFKEFEGTLVANAECPACLAKYLAWVDERPRVDRKYEQYFRWAPQYLNGKELPYFDLSYRSTFNDEPGPDDLPVYKVVWKWLRVKKLK